MPKLFILNANSSTHSADFTDDFITLGVNQKVEAVQAELENLANKIVNHYNMWNLTVTNFKCETFLLHKPIRLVISSARKGIKNFKVKIYQEGQTCTAISENSKV